MLRSLFSVSAFALALIAAGEAFAAQRTFVSTTGSDSNTASNCSNTAPCRGFAAALTVTDSGGEIIVLNSGGYGSVTIGQSVSINAPDGVYAGISVSSGNGITVATAGVQVSLRGLTINRLAGSGHGISMTAGNSLVIDNCTVKGFAGGNGVYVAGVPRVKILDTLAANNSYGAVLDGVSDGVVSRSRFFDSTYVGLLVTATVAMTTSKVTVFESEASGSNTGFYADAGAGGDSLLVVQHSVSRNFAHAGAKAYGSDGTARLVVSDSLLTALPGGSSICLRAEGGGGELAASGNTFAYCHTGLENALSALVRSTGDNKPFGVTTLTLGTITSVSGI